MLWEKKSKSRSERIMHTSKGLESREKKQVRETELLLVLKYWQKGQWLKKKMKLARVSQSILLRTL